MPRRRCSPCWWRMLRPRTKSSPPRALPGSRRALAGVVVMIGPDVLRDLGANVLAQLACLLAAISYAFAGVYGRRFRGEPALRVAAGQLTASSVILALPVALIDRPWMLPLPEPHRNRGAGRAGRTVHGARLSDLFPHPRARRSHQRAAGDVPDPGQRDPARHAGAGRTARRAPSRRHGGHRARPCGDRREGSRSCSEGGRSLRVGTGLSPR